MKFMLCPQCGISNFYLLNDNEERLNVKVTRELEIVPIDKSKSLDGYNLDELFCLGCSWHGKVSELIKYLA
ncbi:MAG: hypothetical protein PF485_08930 [Bacteroidales bacterium]|jgi:hypothetical protein|nr:hypothetical protein [Bacteroidales bacterium]